MSYAYVDGVRLSETSLIEFWRKKSYPNVGAVRPRETNRNTRDVCVWGWGGCFLNLCTKTYAGGKGFLSSAQYNINGG